jgi:hypothetical protein
MLVLESLSLRLCLCGGRIDDSKVACFSQVPQNGLEGSVYKCKLSKHCLVIVSLTIKLEVTLATL